MRGRIKACHDLIRNKGIVCNPLGGVRKPSVKVAEREVNERVEQMRDDGEKVKGAIKKLTD